MTGTLTKVISLRGFAFALGEDGQEYFVQAEALADGVKWETLCKGQQVEFTPQTGGRGGNGLRAVDVRIIG